MAKSSHLAVVATVMLLAALVNGRALLQVDNAAPKITAPSKAAPHDTIFPQKAAPHNAGDVQMGVTRNGSMAPLKAGNYKFDYTLNLQNTSEYRVFARDPQIDIAYGCGSENQKCSCVPVVDPYRPFLSTFRMHGEGTDGSATGIEFTCKFTVSVYHFATKSSTPDCACSFHIDNPYSSSNHWYIDCPCLSGFNFGAIPSGGHDFTISDTVSFKG